MSAEVLRKCLHRGVENVQHRPGRLYFRLGTSVVLLHMVCHGDGDAYKTWDRATPHVKWYQRFKSAKNSNQNQNNKKISGKQKRTSCQLSQHHQLPNLEMNKIVLALPSFRQTSRERPIFVVQLETYSWPGWKHAGLSGRGKTTEPTWWLMVTCLKNHSF